MKSKDEMFIIDERIRKENIKLKVEILEKNKEIKRLNNIINKSIAYINNLSNEPNVFGHYGIDSRCKNCLLNILKGNDKE